MTGSRIARIVSGGQTGADRAALDVAEECGIECGGWCPRGGWAEDFPAPPGLLDRYPRLREATSADPRVRTLLNVRDSHATLVVRSGSSPSSGTDLAADHAATLGRPCLVTSGADTTAVVEWLESLPAEITLNVAGPRESEQPGVYATTRSLLRAVIARAAASAGG